MPNRFPFPTVFPCGRGALPGTRGPGIGGYEPPITPIILSPVPPGPSDPPFDPPYGPTRKPGGGEPPVPGGPQPRIKWKCVDTNTSHPGPPPAGTEWAEPNNYKKCVPCDGAAAPGGFGANPTPGSAGCTHASKALCEAACVNKTVPIPGEVGRGGPSVTSVGGGSTTGGTVTSAGGGPTTGGTQYYRCKHMVTNVCPGYLNEPVNQQLVTSFEFQCVTCQPNIVLGNGEVVPDPECIYAGLAACQGACIEEVFTGITCPSLEPSISQSAEPQEPLEPNSGSGGVLEPTGFSNPGQGVVTLTNEFTPLSIQKEVQAVQITSNQEAMTATTISANEVISPEDYRQQQRGTTQPQLYDPNLNFFKVEPNTNTQTERNYATNTLVFNREMSPEVSKLLSIQNSNIPWDEVSLQNLSDDKLLASLDSKIVNSFQYLRYPGGKPVGMTTLLNVIRKHLLEGTIDEFDYNYFRDVSLGQFESSFEIIEGSENPEYTERFAIEYLANNLHTFENNKPSDWRNFQINRARPLNEDLNIEVAVTTLGGEVKSLRVPNQGIEVDKITKIGQITVPSVGSPSSLNIGNGGGYYINGEDLQSQGVAVPSTNIINQSYYAPPAIRMKVLDMLNVSPVLTFSATSLTNKHEFASGDLGPSATKPLFFALNLGSVKGSYTENPLIENYSGTYSLLTNSEDIQVYMNNNALNTPMLSIDYRDPIYRYILDTSTVTVSLNDFNLAAFPDQGLSSIGSRFVKNIPFGIVVTPVAGGMYNPFNGSSKLVSYGDTHTRSLSVLPAVDATIDESSLPMFEAYNLNLVDGVDRVGASEDESTQNIGYRYVESNFTNTFYSASAEEYRASSAPASSYGTSYLLKDVIDYLSNTYNPTTLTWFDVFSRMPVNQIGRMFYDSNKELILDIAKGLRNNITFNHIEGGHNTISRIIPEDSKTIVSFEDRYNITRVTI